MRNLLLTYARASLARWTSTCWNCGATVGHDTEKCPHCGNDATPR